MNYTPCCSGLESKLDKLEDALFPQGCFYVFLQMLQTRGPSTGSWVILEAPREEGFWGWRSLPKQAGPCPCSGQAGSWLWLSHPRLARAPAIGGSRHRLVSRARLVQNSCRGLKRRCLVLEQRRRRDACPKHAMMSATRLGFHVTVPFPFFCIPSLLEVDRACSGPRTSLGTVVALWNCSGGCRTQAFPPAPGSQLFGDAEASPSASPPSLFPSLPSVKPLLWPPSLSLPHCDFVPGQNQGNNSNSNIYWVLTLGGDHSELSIHYLI